jgi:hypothetical protein
MCHSESAQRKEEDEPELDIDKGKRRTFIESQSQATYFGRVN